jgi:hypothetical protein
MPPTLKPKELRPLLHRKLDELPDADLDKVHRFLLQQEIGRLMESISEGIDEAAARGEMTPESIEQSIREHRARHPYR